MTRFYFAPLTLIVLGACNTEQAYWDLIDGHGVTCVNADQDPPESAARGGGVERVEGLATA